MFLELGLLGFLRNPLLNVLDDDWKTAGCPDVETSDRCTLHSDAFIYQRNVELIVLLSSAPIVLLMHQVSTQK